MSFTWIGARGPFKSYDEDGLDGALKEDSALPTTVGSMYIFDAQNLLFEPELEGIVLDVRNF